MMQDPLVSVIVPCFNQASYLPEALQSVQAQLYQNWECIIVNDGSTDETETIAQTYQKKDKRFKYLLKENGGPSSARNAGIKSSSGEYILPLDADDKISPNYLQLAVTRFQDLPETKLVYCNAEFYGMKSGKWNLPDYEYERILFMNVIFCSGIFKRNDFDKTNGYSIELTYGYEDWDFWISLLNQDDIVFRIPETCFFYRVKENSRSTNISHDTSIILFRQIVLNHLKKYDRYFTEIQNLNLLLQDKDNEIVNLQNNFEKIISSKAYKLGKKLTKPFSLIMIRKKYTT